jgi:type I restriction enzyme S subunit
MKVVKLSEICTFTRGLTYSKSDEVDFSNNVVLRANNIDLDSNSLNLEDLRYIKDSIQIKKEKIARRNSLIICTASGSKSHVGKVALIDEDYGYAFGGFMGQLTPTDICHPKFLYYILTSGSFKDFLMSLNDGTNINNLKFTDIENYEVPLPSLEKQSEIIKKLDSAFAEIDLLEGNLEIGEERSNELLHSLLNESFTYTLAEEGSYIALSNHEIDVRMVQLKDVVSFDKKQGSFDLAYVGLEDIESNSGSLLGSREPRKVKSNSFAFTSEHLLYGRLRPYLNKVLLPDFDGHCSTEIFPIKVTKDILREYLFYWFRLPSTVEAIDETSTGARMPRANMDAVLEFQIPLPPIEKQTEIVQKLDKALTEIDLLKAQIKVEKDYVVALRQSLLSSAFSIKEAVA